MSAWPIGVRTCELIFPTPLGADGKPAFDTYVTVEMQAKGTAYLIWEADGTIVVPAAVNQRNPGTIAVPVVDQAGWLDDQRQPYRDISYVATIQHCPVGTTAPAIGPYEVPLRPTTGDGSLTISRQQATTTEEPQVFYIEQPVADKADDTAVYQIGTLS